MIFLLCKWCFDINWHVFQIHPNAIHLNPLQFCPAMPLLGFPVFCLSSSIVLIRYFHILVNSMIIWAVLKLPKIAWPSPFKSEIPSRSLAKFHQVKRQNFVSRQFICLLGFRTKSAIKSSVYLIAVQSCISTRNTEKRCLRIVYFEILLFRERFLYDHFTFS